MNEPHENNTNKLHIEVKGEYIYGHKVDKIINKKNVIAVVTTDKISKPGKNKFEEAGIAYAENIPEGEFMESEDREDG